MTKQEIIEKVDSSGRLLFSHWYKNKLFYKNDKYKVVIQPEYRDECSRDETLKNLLCCDDYYSVTVYDGDDEIFKGHGER